jgi:hypothetical protein
MAAQNELLAEAILEDKLVVIMLFQQLVYKLATSPVRTYLVGSLSSKIASASNSFCAAILDVYFRILRMRCYDNP